VERLRKEKDGGFWKLFPDELEHQELVEIGIEQGPRDRVQFPVVVVGAAGQVDNHNPNTLPYSERSSAMV